MKPETKIMHAVHHAVNASGLAIVWRNDVGKAEVVREGLVVQHLTYGLGVGSADLIGCLVPSGKFLGLEIKTATGRLSEDQRLWLAVMAKRGALVGVVRSVDEALALIRSAA